MTERSPVSTAVTQPAVLYVGAEPDCVCDFVRTFGVDFTILTATSVDEAKALLAGHGERVGVLVSDQHLAVQSGTELLSFAKTRYPFIVRVLTSAHLDLDTMGAIINSAEVYRYVPKPWDIGSLRGELHSAMELHNRHRHEQELIASKRKTAATLAAHIAHEMATPLTTIRMLASSLEEYFPALFDAYRQQAHSSESPHDRSAIPKEILNVIAAAPTTMRTVAERAQLLMQLMLVNAREDANDTSDFRPISMHRCIQYALETYAFGEGEAELVQVEGEDFDVWGSEIFLTFVLYNLLKNALHALRTARQGEVRIRIQPGSPYNTLIFRDTGSGIPADALPQVFEEFFTATGNRNGTGMGLPFCRRVMRAFGGRIDCRSQEGEFTELRLSFPYPKVEEPALPR